MYLDHAATTPVRKEILDSYYELLSEQFANPSSLHRLGQESSRLLNKARAQIAGFFHRTEEEVIFTSGATEANNLAIKGYCFRYQNRGKHCITTKIEHPSVLRTFEQLEQFGFTVTYLDVDETGKVRLDDLKREMRDDTILVSIMAVNNEVGAINDTKGIAKIVHDYPKASFHSDTTQAIGKVDIDYDDIDMFVLSAHKLYGLKGSGALIKRKNIEFLPLNSGGGQEFGYRSGTNDFPKEVMLAKTLRLLFLDEKKDREHVKELFMHLYQKLKEMPNIRINSTLDGSYYILNFSLLNKRASVVVEALSKDNIMVSTISACSSKKTAHSVVLEVMGRSKQEYQNSIRISFGHENTLKEVDLFVEKLQEILNKIR